MAYALAPEGALEALERPLAVETEGRQPAARPSSTGGAKSGRPDNVRILLRYDQARFDALIAAALAAG